MYWHSAKYAGGSRLSAWRGLPWKCHPTCWQGLPLSLKRRCWPQTGLVQAACFLGTAVRGTGHWRRLRGGAAHPAPRRPRGVRRFPGVPPRLCECPEHLSWSFSHILCMCYANGGLHMFATYKNSCEYLQIYIYIYIGSFVFKNKNEILSEYGIFIYHEKNENMYFWPYFTIFWEWFCHLIGRLIKEAGRGGMNV